MHKFIFETDRDRNNRRCLHKFSDFEVDDDSPNEFRTKLQYAVGFSIRDLISICNILDTLEMLRERIVRALMDVSSLQSVRDRDKSDKNNDHEKSDESSEAGEDVADSGES